MNINVITFFKDSNVTPRHANVVVETESESVLEYVSNQLMEIYEVDSTAKNASEWLDIALSADKYITTKLEDDFCYIEDDDIAVSYIPAES